MATAVLRYLSLGLAALAAGWSFASILRAADASDPQTRRRIAFQKAVIAISMMVLVPELLGVLGSGMPAGAVRGVLLVVLLYYIFAGRK